ncbi:MAG: primosomal protein N' [Propionibacteriaceae bacterium]
MPETPPLVDAPVRVAHVAVDVSLPHLDRAFDYAITPAQDTDAVVGARVRVRFAGRLRDGFILSVDHETEHPGKLAPLEKVVSAEPVLAVDIATLIRSVADHYAGCFADVMRLAVPPRHATTEKATPRTRNAPDLDRAAGTEHPFDHYRTGPDWLAAVRAGGHPRAAWQVIPQAGPAGDWTAGFVAAATATLQSGRGVLAVVPGQRDVDRLAAACRATLGKDAFVTLTADLGPSARYRAFLAARRGDVRVVIGTRAAAFAPVADLGLIALWDDGDDLLAEPRAPYPHAREVLTLRAASTGAAVLYAAYARSVEVQRLAERGWLADLAAERRELRHQAPLVRIAGDSDFALAKDAYAQAARLPHDVFEVIRGSLPRGPVLVQVPRAGQLPVLVCADCREVVRCPHCSGPARATGGGRDRTVGCGWCGRLLTQWRCPHCDGHRWRAPVVGADRTADELGKAFPNTLVRRSTGGAVLDTVPDVPSLVIATPGAEPDAEDGYAAVALLDAGPLLMRPDLRAGEEALRRWLNAAALARPGYRQGTVIAVGPVTARPLQALVRLDPVGHADRELAERAEAHFPPAAKMITVEGRPSAVAEFGELLDLGDLPAADVLGPVEVPRFDHGRAPDDDPVLHRLTLRCPLPATRDLVAAVRAAVGVRSARKDEGALRVRVDPVTIA